MKKTIRLTESDLIRLIKRVINEGIIQEFDRKPEDFIKEFKEKKLMKGTWLINDNQLKLWVEGDRQWRGKYEPEWWYIITCNPQSNQSSQQQGQQPTKESYLREGKSDLDILIKRVINEGIVEELDYTPEDFAKQFKGKKGTWFIKDNSVVLVVEGDTMHWYIITCNPQSNQSSQQQGQQPTKESYLRKYKKLY